MAGKSTMRSEPDIMPRPSDEGNSARKHAAEKIPLNLILQVPVPQTDTRSRDEYSKALE